MHEGLSPSRLRAVDRDLDWEPDVKAPPTALPPPRPGSSSYMPPPPPPPPATANDAPFPFRSRREIVLTMLGGSAALWLLNHKVIMPIDSFGDKPPVDFTLAGYTDLKPEEFVYFKTPGGRWVAAAEDDQGRFFMIDEVGDLYYDSGDPDVGLYAMDTQGNLFNFYRDPDDGEQKITPVGNVSDLKQFKISEIAGIKLDRDVNVVAFQDGSTAPLPPGSTYRDPYTGELRGPDQLVEGLNGASAASSRSSSSSSSTTRRGFFESIFGGGGGGGEDLPVQRFEVDLNDPRDFDEQMEDQQFLADPDDPTAPILPPDFDIDALARQVEADARAKGR
ncbi:hypothetical protein VOLCADRAFT_117417 [Volvox carteri f. nagariensis]|uniref:Uncharacterized protein n=1 Tax=Volvox carteri f. nagariensis TaxID=3068 RepID=D8TU72_VOLCA|nr:uncharacterized protein VOLCADRAFT_117417 [Volvox carteri f. nagariensis]EFJ49095.1 hypothetical protein VOLCADRAFT_117417 [Volvox carteri f. nagariensis]|eukprot:XP_002949992.1 hypothetical protein VOLCADRAFT_117417 [Volvox carteri f. nagariensis]